MAYLYPKKLCQSFCKHRVQIETQNAATELKPAGICRIQNIFRTSVCEFQFGTLSLRWALEPRSSISSHRATATVKSVNLSKLLQNPCRAQTPLLPHVQHIKDSTVLHIDIGFPKTCPYMTKPLLISFFNICAFCAFCVCVPCEFH